MSSIFENLEGQFALASTIPNSGAVVLLSPVIYTDKYVESERVTNGFDVELGSTTFTTTFHTSEPATSPVTSRATSAVLSTTTGDANIVLL